MAIWGMWLRPGEAGGTDLTAEGILGHFICIGWDAPDYAGLSDAALRDALKEYHSHQKRPNYVAEQMFRFLRGIKPTRDLVIVPCHKRDEYYVARILGRVQERTVDGYGEVLSRRVEWFNPRSPWKKSALPKTFQFALRKRQTIWGLTEFGPFLKERILRPPEPDPTAPKDNGQFDTPSKAFSYFLKGGQKKVFPGHKNFQVRLKQYLSLMGVGSRTSFEKDHIDVQFHWKGEPYIGEIKVSSKHLSAKEAFRAALGQILEYKHLKPEARDSSMVIFMDKTPAEQRIQLARRLGIAIIVEDRNNNYRLQSPPPPGASALAQLFRPCQMG